MKYFTNKIKKYCEEENFEKLEEYRNEGGSIIPLVRELYILQKDELLRYYLKFVSLKGIFGAYALVAGYESKNFKRKYISYTVQSNYAYFSEERKLRVDNLVKECLSLKITGQKRKNISNLFHMIVKYNKFNLIYKNEVYLDVIEYKSLKSVLMRFPNKLVVDYGQRVDGNCFSLILEFKGQLYCTNWHFYEEKCFPNFFYEIDYEIWRIKNDYDFLLYERK